MVFVRGKMPLGFTSLSDKMALKQCPYLDKDCPKQSKIELMAMENNRDIKTLFKYVYIIMGMLALNTGLILW